jgi:hypothetical protein
MKAYLWSDGTPPPATRQARWRGFVERHLPSVVIYLMVATLVAVVLYPHVVVTVPQRACRGAVEAFRCRHRA